MESLLEQYRDIFSLSTGHPKKTSLNDETYFISLDAEWFGVENRNVVLSYQLATASPCAVRNIIRYMPPGKRMRLAELIEEGIKSVHGDELPRFCPGKRFKVILIAHNTTAEWSVLADRDDPTIVKKLMAIRKTPVTGSQPIRIHLSDHSPVLVHLYDTMHLAPAGFKSLLALSSLLGDQSLAKDDISQHDKEHMDLFLKRDPAAFERYALRDTEVTLRLFFLLQRSLNQLAYGEFRHLFRTLAAAAVEYFLRLNPWFQDYRQALGKPEFWAPKRLAERAYHGGRNETFFVGRTADHPQTRGRIWVDVDFSSCYPTAMALCPKIDTDPSKVDYRPLRYHIDEQVVERLEREGIAPEIIAAAQKALGTSVESFDQYLKDLSKAKKGKLAWTLRQQAILIDNGLVQKWQRQTQPVPGQSDHRCEGYVIPGFAEVRFRFPAQTQYPCLPVRDPNFGLIYPLQGETYATASEIVLAVQAGAQIEVLTSVEFGWVERDGQAECCFSPSLRHLIAERTRYKAEKTTTGAIMEKLVKETVNSLYGKTAQAINPRPVQRVKDGDTELLGPSKISEPIMASLTTGQARAALSALFLAVERFNDGKTMREQIVVISGTTDGLILGLPAPEDYTVLGDFFTNPTAEECVNGVWPRLIASGFPPVESVLDRFGCGGLWSIMESYPALRQMRQAREHLTEDRTYIEIKHVADEVISYKTRGQTGLFANGLCSFIAKFGQRAPFSDLVPDPEERKRVMAEGGMAKNTIEANWIAECADSGGEKLQEYNFYTLHSFKEILKGKSQDLTQKVTPRKFNSAYDCKRRLVWQVDPQTGQRSASPFTLPFDNLAQMKKNRGVAEALVKTNQKATPERILERLEQPDRSTRLRGGHPTTLVRTVLRGVLQGHIPASEPLTGYTELVQGLNRIWAETNLATTQPKTWSKADLSNAKRGNWEPGSLPPSLPLFKLLVPLCQLLGSDLETVKDRIFTSDRAVEESLGLVEAVAHAVLRAPQQGMEPYRTLFLQGRLPTRQGILDAFYPHLTQTRLAQLERTPLVEGRWPRDAEPRIRRLLYRLGLHGPMARDCAQPLVKATMAALPERKSPRNPKCTEVFIHALQQPDIVTSRVPVTRVLQHLVDYQVTAKLYNGLKKQKFIPRMLSDSAANRLQIREMAYRLDLDPQPFIRALLNR